MTNQMDDHQYYPNASYLVQLSKANFEDLVEQAVWTTSSGVGGGGVDSQKRLTSPLINQYLGACISTSERHKVKLTHISSAINLRKLRGDTKFLTAYAKCTFNSKCPSTYNILVKEKIYDDDDNIQVSILRNNAHNHLEPIDEAIEGEDRSCSHITSNSHTKYTNTFKIESLREFFILR